jgi:hypothetical protein
MELGKRDGVLGDRFQVTALEDFANRRTEDVTVAQETVEPGGDISLVRTRVPLRTFDPVHAWASSALLRHDR